MLQSFQGLLAIGVLPLIAWALSENRRMLPPAAALRIVAGGLAAQFGIAIALLAIPQARVVLGSVGAAVGALQDAMLVGMRFAFGYLAGGPTPYLETAPGNGFILGLQALPLILVMSVISKLLYHWGILQIVISALSRVLRRLMGVSGPLGTAAAAKIFVGMVEAPLLIKPYLATLGRGELFAIMSVGMATVAGTVFALFGAILEPVVPGAAGHVLTASLMNVPAALVLARLMVPDGYEPPTNTETEMSETKMSGLNSAANTMDAIAQGTSEGLKLLANVIAMLVVMVALVALANKALGAAVSPFGLTLTIEQVFGAIAAPFAFMVGIPWAECGTAGSLLGLKVVLSEFLAYLELAKVPPEALSLRSRTIMTYALCGFGNFSSLGIMVGGISAMVPERRAEIAALGLRSVLCGFMASLLTGAIVGIVLGFRG
jgi:concentrative nucleoside transporter, CNT family